MKRIMVSALVIASILCGCAGNKNTPSSPKEISPTFMKSTKSTVTSHSHSNKIKDNTVSNPITGFCGNTVTTITKDGKEYSFWGGDSVEITSMLINLDLSDSVCECSPEFTVDIELGEDFSVNLSDGWVRKGGCQTDLTYEQTESFKSIISKLEKSGNNADIDKGILSINSVGE